jgi:hypothetical protein
MAAVMVLFAAGVLAVDGHLPAPIGIEAAEYSLSDLADALRSVDSKGTVDLAELKKRHASLERYLNAMTAVSPDTRPDDFPTVEARLAFWLNAYHAAVLSELMDARGLESHPTDELFRFHAIGGKRVTRFSIFRNVLSQSGDARVLLSIATGEKGRGVLDGAPFDPESINLQLDDAMRRFVRRKDHFSLEGKQVKLSELFLRHSDDFLAALPEERKNVLQIVWAYLPESCEADVPGCETRIDLDRACGVRFDACQIEWVPVDQALAVKN